MRGNIVSFRFHKLLAQLVLWAIHRRLGEEAAQHWLWAMTPFPAALPSPHQFVLGVRMVAFPDRWESIAAEYEHRCDQAYRRMRRQEKEDEIHHRRHEGF